MGDLHNFILAFISPVAVQSMAVEQNASSTMLVLKVATGETLRGPKDLFFSEELSPVEAASYGETRAVIGQTGVKIVGKWCIPHLWYRECFKETGGDLVCSSTAQNPGKVLVD